MASSPNSALWEHLVNTGQFEAEGMLTKNACTQPSFKKPMNDSESPTSVADALGFASAHIAELPPQTVSTLLAAAGIDAARTGIDHPVAIVSHTGEPVQRF